MTEQPILGIVRLGEVSYAKAWSLQQRLHALRVEGKVPDLLVLLSHPHVLTTGSCGGRADRWSNLNRPRAELEARGVDLIDADRGGDITWHGPGQLVGYPIVDLAGYGKDIGRYVRMIEAIQMRVLETLSIGSERQKGFTGVWIGNTKICAIGVRIRAWTTMHGFALNIRGPLEGFDWIVPCGLEGRGVTSIERQLAPDVCPSDADVVELVIKSAGAVFERSVPPTTLAQLLPKSDHTAFADLF